MPTNGHLDAGEPLAALRCAFWIGVTLASGGEMAAPAAGSAAPSGCSIARRRARRGRVLLLPLVFEQEAAGELEAAAATAAKAAEIGERFGEPDLFALAAHEQGHILIRLGRLKEGLALLDEAMVAVAGDELSPIASGIVYCGVILACQDAHELRRAQEWTVALTGWCERQPELVAFTGRCRSTAPRSCGCAGPGRRRSRRPGGPPSAASRERTRRQRARPITRGRDPPSARRSPCGGGGLPRGEWLWVGTAARIALMRLARGRPAPRRPRSAGRHRRPGSRKAGGPTARLRRDHACRG